MNIQEMINKHIEEYDLNDSVKDYIDRHIDEEIRYRIEQSTIKCIQFYLKPIDDELSKLFHPDNKQQSHN